MFGLGLTQLLAQSCIITCGGNTSSSGGSISYSVGQISYQTFTKINGSIAYGIQYPYEILVIDGTEDAKEITLTASVYPNPATNYLKLEFKKNDFLNLSYQIYDSKCMLLQNDEISGNQTSIDLINFVPGTYYIKILQGGKIVKTCKVIKK